MRRLLLFIFLIGLFAVSLHAQDSKLVQFSGIIYNTDSTKTVVPYVSVLNKTRNQTFPANYQGYFSFVATEGDTIIFSSIGFRTEALVIPTGLPERKYTVLVKMKPESISLPQVNIYPWATVDEFTRAFLAFKLADDDLLLAKKNVSGASIMTLSRTLPRQASEMSTINFQNNHFNLSNKGLDQRATNPLLSPFAWAAFINQIVKGDKSRGAEN